MRTVLALLLVAWTTAGAAPAGAAPDDDRYAPLDQPGPPLQDEPDVLDATVRCPEDLGGGDHAVLLVHGTALDADTNFAWGYQPALTAEGYRVCLVDLVEHGMGDNQRSAERVVHAVREIFEVTGVPIGIVGYSQGGQVPRWALRFWPDIRPMVDDLITLSAPNNGALFADGLCAAPCAAAAWQQRMVGSRYIAALNSRATTFPGVDATSIYTRLDEIATPNVMAQSSYLPGATNIATQDVCALNVAEHLLLGTVDPVGYALVVDALGHDGPADPARVPASVCTQLFLPGIDPLEVPGRLVTLGQVIAASLLSAPLLPAEPPLRCYVTASCDASPSGRPGGASTAPPAGSARPGDTGTAVVAPARSAEILGSAAAAGPASLGGPSWPSGRRGASLPATGAETPLGVVALAVALGLALRAHTRRATS